MNKDTKLLLFALVIVLVGAASFNYVNTTGKVISRGLTRVIVAPKTVEAGDFIYISVTPGKQGVYRDIDIYRAKNDFRVGAEQPKMCRDSKCFEKETIPYRISESFDRSHEWPYGVNSKEYYIRVYDIYSEKYVRSYFTIESAYKAEGPQVHR